MINIVIDDIFVGVFSVHFVIIENFIDENFMLFKSLKSNQY